MARSSERATITEVARAAGVSLATVSRVMNDNPKVDPILAGRVRTAAEKLGYRASPLARSLVSGRTETIAVVVPDLANPTFQAILRGLSRAAASDGIHILIADSAEQVDDEPSIAAATRRRTDGVVLCAPRMPHADLAALLPSLSPVVVINRPQLSQSTPSVSADYGAAMRELIEHLYGLGHLDLVFLSGVSGSSSGNARRQAVDAALAEHTDLRITEIPCGVTFESGAEAAEAVRASGATGVLAFNDLVAMGLLSAITQLGIHVPEELSITGFDDIPFAEYTSPPLTTATVPAEELGREAWSAMRSLLSAKTPAGQLVMTPALIVRGSTGPAPRD